MFDHLNNFVQGSDGVCFTEEERTNTLLSEAKEVKEETGGQQAKEVETPDLIIEGEGEPVVTSASPEVENGGDLERTTNRRKPRRKMLSKKQLLVLKGVYKSKQYLTPEESKNLASNLKLSRDQVTSWFTQRRYNQKGTQPDGLHHCGVCDKTFQSRAGSLAHRQKHLRDFPIPMMTTRPFFTFDPNNNDRM